MKTLSCYLMASMLFGAVFGQTRGVAAFFRAGYTHLSVSEQKMALMCQPVSSFHKNYFGIGGEAYLKMKKNILGWDGMVVTHGPSSKDSFYAEPFAINSSLKFGYIVFETKDLFIYPAIGAGAGLLGITTYIQNGHDKKDINTMYVVSATGEFSLNADKMVHTFANGRATGAFLFGIRAGYRVSNTSDDWKKMPNAYARKVKMSTGGYYVTISLGAGNFRKIPDGIR